jgi:hypothetical protein
MNISTVRATPEQRDQLDKIVKKLGFSSIAHFFTRSMETLFEQDHAGQKLTWPLRYEETKRPKADNKLEPPKTAKKRLK